MLTLTEGTWGHVNKTETLRLQMEKHQPQLSQEMGNGVRLHCMTHPTPAGHHTGGQSVATRAADQSLLPEPYSPQTVDLCIHLKLPGATVSVTSMSDDPSPSAQ